MTAAQLIDAGFLSSIFTWRGIRNGHLVEERLDRGLINASWQQLWPNTTVTHCPAIGSDHSPIIIDNEPWITKGKCPFKFESFWTKDIECREIITKCWASSCGGGSMAKCLTGKIKCLPKST